MFFFLKYRFAYRKYYRYVNIYHNYVDQNKTTFCSVGFLHHELITTICSVRFISNRKLSQSRLCKHNVVKKLKK